MNRPNIHTESGTPYWYHSHKELGALLVPAQDTPSGVDQNGHTEGALSLVFVQSTKYHSQPGGTGRFSIQEG